MEATNTTADLMVPVEDFKALIEAAPKALELNQLSLTKALSAGQALLDTIQAEGMSDEMDKAVNDYLVKLRNSLENMENRRKPTTAIFDKVKSVFTALEAQISPKTKDGIYSKLQELRNDWAAKKAEQQREQERQAAIKLAKDKEVVTLRSQAEAQIRQSFAAYLNSIINKLNSDFEKVTLEKYDAAVKYFKQFNNEYAAGQYATIAITLVPQYITREEAKAIAELTKGELYDGFASEFTEVINATIQRIIDMLPGKKQNLQAAEDARIAAEDARIAAEKTKGAAAKAEAEKHAAELKQQQEQLAREEEERKIAETARLQEEERKREEAAEAERKAKEAEGMANTLFDATMNAVPVEQNGQVREGYEIIVNKAPGWMQIIAKWYELEGNKLALDKFGAKKLDSMKGVCEKHASKTGEKINSPFIEYKAIYKAVAKKD